MACFLMCVCAKLLWSCLTLCDLIDYSPPVSSIHGITQARILEWVAFLPSGDLPHLGMKLLLLHIVCWWTGSLSPAPPLKGWYRFQGCWYRLAKLSHRRPVVATRWTDWGTQPQLPCGSRFSLSTVRPVVQGRKTWGSGNGWPCALDLVKREGRATFPSAPCMFVVLFMDDLGSFPPEPASCLVGFPAQKPPVWPDTQIWSNPSWLCTNCWG